MANRNVVAARSHVPVDLHHAARFFCGDHLWSCGCEVVCFALANLLGQVGLQQVVDARGAAAIVAAACLNEVDLGDLLAQLARLAGDALAVAQVARVIVYDPRSARRRGTCQPRAGRRRHLSHAAASR